MYPRKSEGIGEVY